MRVDGQLVMLPRPRAAWYEYEGADVTTVRQEYEALGVWVPAESAISTEHYSQPGEPWFLCRRPDGRLAWLSKLCLEPEDGS